MDEIEERLAEQGRLRRAERGRVGVVHEREAAGHVHAHHHLVLRLDEAAVARFAGAERILRGVALGDVASDRLQLDRSAGGVEHGADLPRHPPHAPRRQVATLDEHAVRGLVQRAYRAAHQPVVVGMNEVEERPPEDGLALLIEAPDIGVVHEDHAPLEVHPHDPLALRLDETAIAALAGTQGRLRRPALVDVATDAADPDDHAALVDDRARDRLDPARPARRRVLDDGRRQERAGEHGFERRDDVGIVGMVGLELVIEPPEDAGGGDAEKARLRFVDVGDATLAVGRPDEIGRLVGEIAIGVP